MRAELPTGTEALARFLIGTVLEHQIDGARIAGRIVETEAYVVGDASSHAFHGRTKRNASMFGPVGTAYVYFIYGTSHCLNVASEEEGTGAAVLIRAIEPLAGLTEMCRRRGDLSPRDLARGPGRLTAAFGIDRRHDGIDLCGTSTLRLLRSADPALQVAASARIGLTRERDRVLRFFERGSQYVSGPQRLNA